MGFRTRFPSSMNQSLPMESYFRIFLNDKEILSQKKYLGNLTMNAMEILIGFPILNSIRWL